MIREIRKRYCERRRDNMPKEKIIDSIIYLMCEGHTANEIAETLCVNKKAVEIIMSKLEIVRF